MSEADETFMRHALKLAACGRGFVEPNPLVGCVIERGGRVLGEGFHEKFGGPHAEINALAVCRESPAGATMHVTLEPCCHTNKKTPPCVPRLIEAKVARVVVGCLDPNPHVSGQGAAQLRAAGIDVQVGVLEAECRQMNAAYIARVVHNRPYVTLKWAVSADGKIAAPTLVQETSLPRWRPIRITNGAATAAVHALRGRCDAIAIGTNTLVNDDPLLTARTDELRHRPIRVLLTNRLSIPSERRLLTTPNHGSVIVYTTADSSSSPAQALREQGVEIVSLPARDNGRGEMRFAMADVYGDLHRRGVTHLLIEPGAKLARELMARGEADRVWVFHGQIRVGEAGMSESRCPWPEIARLDLAGDTLVEHLNPSSEVCFSPHASADLSITAASDP